MAGSAAASQPGAPPGYAPEIGARIGEDGLATLCHIGKPCQIYYRYYRGKNSMARDISPYVGNDFSVAISVKPYAHDASHTDITQLSIARHYTTKIPAGNAAFSIPFQVAAEGEYVITLTPAASQQTDEITIFAEAGALYVADLGSAAGAFARMPKPVRDKALARRARAALARPRTPLVTNHDASCINCDLDGLPEKAMHDVIAKRLNAQARMQADPDTLYANTVVLEKEQPEWSLRMDTPDYLPLTLHVKTNTCSLMHVEADGYSYAFAYRDPTPMQRLIRAGDCAGEAHVLHVITLPGGTLMSVGMEGNYSDYTRYRLHIDAEATVCRKAPLADCWKDAFK